MITEVTSEPNVVKRAKILKQFIKIARKSSNYSVFFVVILDLGLHLDGMWDVDGLRYM